MNPHYRTPLYSFFMMFFLKESSQREAYRRHNRCGIGASLLYKAKSSFSPSLKTMKKARFPCETAKKRGRKAFKTDLIRIFRTEKQKVPPQNTEESTFNMENIILNLIP